MKAFIWQDTRPVSTSYHDSGGLVILASDLRAARRAWLTSETARYIDDEYESKNPADAVAEKPDRVLELDPSTKPDVLVFPDAGCC